MNLKELLSSSESLFKKRSVIGFQSAEYPLLFLKKLREHLQEQTKLKTVSIDMNETELAQIRSQLEMSFLGQKNLYWLGDLSTLSLKNYGHWISYLSSYHGPHDVLFFTTKTVKNEVELILVPEQINLMLFKQLLSLWPADEHERILYLAEQIFREIKTLSLDQAVRIADYALVVGAGRSMFMASWLESIIKPESSLFKLSGALFAGDKKGFLELWQRLQTEYEFPFWLTYFSEQFFRAYYYVSCKKEHNHVAAKQIGFRLPFSFLQRDWKRWEDTQLQKAHQRVSDLDFQLKNGGSKLILDSLFTLFL